WILGPLFKGAPNGIGVLSAGIILSVMVIPFIYISAFCFNNRRGEDCHRCT
ncbi:MAG: hypothetical protein HGB17_08450, partial [Syntrophobacteraceae bacterium]|nr:hypothetical protein [Syntrophobacteraceae bacterium]